MHQIIDAVCNLFTPQEVEEGRTGVDQQFLDKVRFPPNMRSGGTIEDYLNLLPSYIHIRLFYSQIII